MNVNVNRNDRVLHVYHGTVDDIYRTAIKKLLQKSYYPHIALI